MTQGYDMLLGYMEKKGGKVRRIAQTPDGGGVSRSAKSLKGKRGYVNVC